MLHYIAELAFERGRVFRPAIAPLSSSIRDLNLASQGRFSRRSDAQRIT